MNDHVDVLVIGGGPAGCTAAAKAARMGRRVRLLEATAHPRAHVGESLLPGITPILADIDALDAVQRAGFGLKTGSTHIHWGTTPRWDLWFADSDAYETSWFVDRARFDAILFDCAVRAGVETQTRAAVHALGWDGERLGAVGWRDAGGNHHETTANDVVDASGAAALVARDRGWLEPIAGMAHHALWAHFSDVGHLPAPRAHQAVFIAEPGRWWWCFPMGDGRASVGVVELDPGSRPGGSARFDAMVREATELHAVLGPSARRCTCVRRERDWSYRVRPAAGPGLRLVGDAAGFIDPVLSTGVFLAMHSAWDAASSLGGADPTAAAAGYARRHAAQFDDLLGMVAFYYQQGLAAEDYFWGSKRILAHRTATDQSASQTNALSPRKAFVMLTSGLVDNLVVQHATANTTTRRSTATQDPAVGIASPSDPVHLHFVCVHLHVPFRAPDAAPAELDAQDAESGPPPKDRASLFLILEADDPAAPCLARTPSLSIDAIAPRLGHNPVDHAAVGPVVRSFLALLRTLDLEPVPLATFWRVHGGALDAWRTTLPMGVAYVRTFGQ